MADNEDYELLPHQQLEDLRKEIEELKKNPLGNVTHGQDLVASVQELTKVMHRFTEMMKATNDEMVADFKRTSVSEHFAQISDQNQRIAEAVLTIAELVKGGNRPQQHNQPMDNMPGMMSQTPSMEPQPQSLGGFVPGQQNQTDMPPPLNQQQPMQGMNPATNNFNNQQAPGELPPLGDQPQPPVEEHHKKGFGGLFKK